MSNDVVIILVNYNSAKDTIACVESIIKNDDPNAFFVIVDNSNQQELEHIKTITDHVHIIYNSENSGFGKANNTGIRWARQNIEFNFILLLNNDTTIETNAIQHLKEVLINDPSVGMATSKIMYYDKPETVWFGGGFYNKRKGAPRIVDFDQKATSDGADKAKNVTFASGCVMLFSKESIAKVQGFTPDFFMYCEDLEISLRTVKLGYTIYYEPKSIIYHKVHASLAQESEQKHLHPKNPNANFLFYHNKSNQFLLMKEYLSAKDFFLFNFHYWAKYEYIVLRMLLHGNFKILATSFKTKMRILKNLFKRLNVTPNTIDS